MDRKHLHCYHCDARLEYEFYHAGFGDQDFFYCNRCGTVATVDWYTADYRPHYERFIATEVYSARKADRIRFENNKRAMLGEITKQLGDCWCGGRFTLEAVPRCPACSRELDWGKLVDRIDETAESYTRHYFRNSVKAGWKGIYYFIFNGRLVKEPWKSKSGSVS